MGRRKLVVLCDGRVDHGEVDEIAAKNIVINEIEAVLGISLSYVRDFGSAVC